MRKLRAKEINDLSQAQDWLEAETRREGCSSPRQGGLLLLQTAGHELWGHRILHRVLKREEGFGEFAELIKM